MKAETRDDLLNVCRQLEAEIDAAHPVADPARLNRIRFLCGKLHGHTGYLSEKAARFQSQAGVYLSARKHQEQRGGAEAVLQELKYRLLDSMRQEIEQAAKGGKT